MSRAHNAKRKARRQEARHAAAKAARENRKRVLRRGHPGILAPVFLIIGILAVTAFVSFGSGSEPKQAQVDQEVDALLADLPQDGSTLGFPSAPITVVVYGDLECPTVKLFVEEYLPSWIDEWIRTGVVSLEYRSLQTDTSNEEIFFAQEMAALAAGRQDRMWNFLLTFVREQGEHFTYYADDAFLADIASRVPDLALARWHKERDDPVLSRRVGLDVYAAHSSDFRYTPSFALNFNVGGHAAFTESDFKAEFIRDIESLRAEADRDKPGLSLQPR